MLMGFSAQVKMVYVASMNDQVVPVYSGAFTCVSHPLILRALYIDGDAYRYASFSHRLLNALTSNHRLIPNGLVLLISSRIF